MGPMIKVSQATRTYYDTLEIPNSSSNTEIHTAYIRAKNTYSSHNRNVLSVFSKQEIEDLRKLIDQAYFILSHPMRRKAYDKEISKSVNIHKEKQRLLSRNMAIKSHYKKNPIFEKQIEERDVFDGPFLQSIRNYKNISISQISLITRIGKPYLIAIENNEYQLLPAPVFVRGFISQYAKCLSLDTKRVVDSYMSLYKALYV